MNSDDMKRLRELEKENARLKKAVADLTVDKQILREIAQTVSHDIRVRQVKPGKGGSHVE